MTTLHLIDGTFELFRAYYALPSSTAPDGREVGAMRGLIASTLALLRDGAVTHVAVATDHVIESFRNRLFAGYKTGDGIPPDLLGAVPARRGGASRARRRASGRWSSSRPTTPSPRPRPASPAPSTRWSSPRPTRTSPSASTANASSLHDRIRRVVYDEAAVRTKFGVPPACDPRLLALVGDSRRRHSRHSRLGPQVRGRRARGLRQPRGHPRRSRNAGRTSSATATALPRRWPCTEPTRSCTRPSRPCGATYRCAESFDDLHWRGVPRRAYRRFLRPARIGDLARAQRSGAPTDRARQGAAPAPHPASCVDQAMLTQRLQQGPYHTERRFFVSRANAAKAVENAG